MSDFWTPERINELERLWHDGLSASKIAEAMGTSKGSITSRARRSDLPMRAPKQSKAHIPPTGSRRRGVLRPGYTGGIRTIGFPGPRECQWPDGEGDTLTFCRKPREDNPCGWPYCQTHFDKARQKKVAPAA